MSKKSKSNKRTKSILQSNTISDSTGIRYIVYNNGMIYDVNKERYIKDFTNPAGYHYVDLFLDGEKVREAVHRLVGLSFIPNPENKPIINHKDGNKGNNWDWNLEWATYRENNLHAYQTGLHKPVKSENVHWTKYSSAQVTMACELMSNGIAPVEVEEITGIPTKLLYQIRDKDIWKEISTKYEFPKSKYPQMKNSPLTPEKREKVDDLVLAGKKPREILDILELPNDWSTYKRVADIKHRLLKVQRLSADQAIGLANGSPLPEMEGEDIVSSPMET